MSDNITDEALVDWAKEKYPEFADNIDLMRACWERENGIEARPKREFQKADIGDLEGLGKGAYVDMEVLVARINRERKYVGCSNCRKKAQNGASQCVCGSEDFKTYRWVDYFVGDKTGNAFVKILLGSEDEDKITSGTMLNFKGRIDSDYSGLWEVMVMELEGDEKPKKMSDDLKTAVEETMDYLELYESEGIKTESFMTWYERQKFEVPYSEVMANIKYNTKDEKIFIEK